MRPWTVATIGMLARRAAMSPIALAFTSCVWSRSTCSARIIPVSARTASASLNRAPGTPATGTSEDSSERNVFDAADSKAATRKRIWRSGLARMQSRMIFPGPQRRSESRRWRTWRGLPPGLAKVVFIGSSHSPGRRSFGQLWHYSRSCARTAFRRSPFLNAPFRPLLRTQPPLVAHSAPERTRRTPGPVPRGGAAPGEDPDPRGARSRRTSHRCEVPAGADQRTARVGRRARSLLPGGLGGQGSPSRVARESAGPPGTEQGGRARSGECAPRRRGRGSRRAHQRHDRNAAPPGLRPRAAGLEPRGGTTGTDPGRAPARRSRRGRVGPQGRAAGPEAAPVLASKHRRQRTLAFRVPPGPRTRFHSTWMRSGGSGPSRWKRTLRSPTFSPCWLATGI